MSTDSRKRPIARWIAAGLLALCSQQVAAQALTLSVPQRPGLGALQTGATTIEFDASTISAGADINVSGQSLPVPASGCVGVACNNLGITGAGDSLLLTRINGTNRVRLQITYLSVTGNPSYCVSTIGAGGLSFPITLTGFTFGGGNGYRITSFMAPSDASCNIPYLRVPTSRPFLSVAGGLTRLGRLPLNIVLVLDKSGSMDWTVPGSADIRWTRLQSSVQLFASVWDAVGAPPPPATVSSEGNADDRLGVVFFSSTATDAPLDGANFFKKRDNNVAPWSVPVTGALAANSPGGWTSIGSGILQARTRLDTVDALAGDTAIVLFTDGEQNRSPCVIRNTETIVVDCDVAMPGASPSELLQINGNTLAQNILPRGPLYTIALGEAGVAQSAQLLEEISQETAGRASYPNNGIGMDTSFVDSLVDHLKGGTVSLVNRRSGTLSPGISSAPLSFWLDSSLTRAVFVLSWEGAGHETQIKLMRPDGSIVTPATTSAGPNFRVAMVDIPNNGPGGNWRAVVTGHGQHALKFQLSAYGVESRLSAHVTETPLLGTGSPIRITADIGWGNGVLAKLPAGAVKAYIERPGEDIGTILHDADYSSDSQDRKRDMSPLALKLDYLAREMKLWDRIEPRRAGKAIELKHIGGGRYSGTFKETSIAGRYRIVVALNWKDRRTGIVHRLFFNERQVPVQPSDTNTVVKVLSDRNSRDTNILVIPRDAFGNYVGPGLAGAFVVKTSRGEVKLTATDPKLKGEYVLTLHELSPDGDPEVGIYFRDRLLREGPLSSIDR
jgi:hypothetical protein